MDVEEEAFERIASPFIFIYARQQRSIMLSVVARNIQEWQGICIARSSMTARKLKQNSFVPSHSSKGKKYIIEIGWKLLSESITMYKIEKNARKLVPCKSCATDATNGNHAVCCFERMLNPKNRRQGVKSSFFVSFGSKDPILLFQVCLLNSSGSQQLYGTFAPYLLVVIPELFFIMHLSNAFWWHPNIHIASSSFSFICLE